MAELQRKLHEMNLSILISNLIQDARHKWSNDNEENKGIFEYSNKIIDYFENYQIKEDIKVYKKHGVQLKIQFPNED